MGFKPQSSLKKYYHIKPAQFIYPDESASTKLINWFVASSCPGEWRNNVYSLILVGNWKHNPVYSSAEEMSWSKRRSDMSLHSPTQHLSSIRGARTTGIVLTNNRLT